MMPPYITSIDRAVWDASAMLQAVAVARYPLTGSDVQPLERRRAGKQPKKITDDDRAGALGISRREYKKWVIVLHGWVGARMGRRAA